MAPQVNPAGTVSVRETTPAKPLRPVIVIVEVAEVPTVTAAGEDAAIVKSLNVKVTLVELLGAPVAVEVTVATEVTAAVFVHVKVEVPLVPRTTLVGTSEQTAPFVAATERFTVPVKAPREATVMVEDPPGEPVFAVTLVGLALRLTPGVTPPVMVTVTAVEFVMSLFVPPLPVKVTV